MTAIGSGNLEEDVLVRHTAERYRLRRDVPYDIPFSLDCRLLPVHVYSCMTSLVAWVTSAPDPDKRAACTSVRATVTSYVGSDF